MVLHDAKYLLVSDLSEILDSHEAGAESWQQNAEAGDELVGGLEVLEPKLVYLLRDRGLVRLLLDLLFNHVERRGANLI